jgi:hypothetical protein
MLVIMIFSYDDDDDGGGGGGGGGGWDDSLTHKMGCLWAWWVERVESWEMRSIEKKIH